MKWGRLVAGGLVLGALTVGAAWLLPSDDYLLLPDTAKPLADRVQVEGEKPHSPGGIYYVDEVVRQASLLEEVAPPTRPEGADLVPARTLVPPGSSFRDRRQQNLRAMDRSQEVAAAVALRELGYDVKAEPEGALVVAVAGDAPAAGKIEPTDVVVAVGGKPVRTPDDLRRLIGTRKPGQDVRLRVRRGEETKEIVVGTVPSPDDPGRPIVGVQVEQSANIKLPLDVEIDLAGVGGPSAGLAFALDIVEELRGNVDRGLRVAATGEIELDGGVLPIGGVKQKVIGARRAGADVFLVPAGDNAVEARKHAGDLRIVPVESFEQALRALATVTRNG
ncbi:MAG: PDZ domain-containing protein [Thermoleophilia bacterium]|nr:PDZ domain-containing protein [Thermoleophilia bacterium]